MFATTVSVDGVARGKVQGIKHPIDGHRVAPNMNAEILRLGVKGKLLLQRQCPCGHQRFGTGRGLISNSALIEPMRHGVDKATDRAVRVNAFVELVRTGPSVPVSYTHLTLPTKA